MRASCLSVKTHMGNAKTTNVSAERKNNSLRLKAKWLDGRVWAYIPDFDVTVGIAPKCGSSSWYALLRDNEYLYYKAPQPSEDSVFVVRHPIERFISLWKNKCRNGSRISIVDYDDPYWAAGWSIDDLLDVMETKLFNHHWWPQSDYEKGLSKKLIPLEEFSDWAEKTGFGKLPHRNKTEGTVELTDEQYRRVSAYYIDDIKLYERAVREYNK